jgi:hypothetical protein
MGFTGRKVAVGIARETTRGTAVVPAYWINHLSQSIVPRTEKVMNESALGVLSTFNDSTQVYEWAEGSIEAKLSATSGGLVLLGAFGTVNSALNADASEDVYDHTFTLSNSNSPQSLTITRKDDVDNRAYPLGMINNFELNMELGDYIKFTADFLASSGSSSTANVSRIEEVEFKPKYASVKMAANLAGLSGATALATVQSFRITVNRNVERDHEAGSNAPYDISVRGIEVNGEIVLRYENATQRDAYLNDTKRAMEISIVNTDETIGTAANPSLTFTMPKVTLEDWNLDQALDDKVTQTLGFQALYDVSEAEQVEAVLTNLVASYTA